MHADPTQSASGNTLTFTMRVGAFTSDASWLVRTYSVPPLAPPSLTVSMASASLTKLPLVPNLTCSIAELVLLNDFLTRYTHEMRLTHVAPHIAPL